MKGDSAGGDSNGSDSYGEGTKTWEQLGQRDFRPLFSSAIRNNA
jgi:hypothetical protein